MIAMALGAALLTVKGGWAAYQDGKTCRAVAEPVRKTTTRARPFAALAIAPGRAPVLNFQIGRPASDGKATLIAGGRSYPLSPAGPLVATTDARAIDAVRAGQSFTVRTRSGFEIYMTRGVATAFDAAFAACR